MIETPTSRPTALSFRQRLTVIALAVGLSVPMVVAAVLKPNAQGMGTHQQLGLPPCTVRVLFDRPCPSCGMTTSWANLLRGRVIGALRANVGGTMLGVLALAGIPYLAVCGIRGRWSGWIPKTTVLIWIASAVVLATLIQWGLRLAAG